MKATLLAVLTLLAFPHSAAAARLVTFEFVAESVGTPSVGFYPVPLGTRVVGTYTFDLDTPAIPGDSSGYTRYENAVKSAELTMEGFGVATGGVGGSIRIGDPVATAGTVFYLSDQYVVDFPITGISMSTKFFGRRDLIAASIRLQDLDREGIDSRELLATPPDLRFFLDNTGPRINADNAELYLAFSTETGGGNANPFRITSLIAVPEPSALTLALSVAAFCVQSRQTQHKPA